MNPERVIIYVDGFNLYYGAVKGTHYKWLNINALCRYLLRPTDKLLQIKYYTARVSARPHDPSAPTRQQMYFRALRTIPNLSIHLGHFLSHGVRLPLVSSLKGRGKIKYAEVMRTEEKGSDVNLASHLIHDAHLDKFSLAVIVSNDSDLCEPLRIVRQELGKSVGVFNPQRHASVELKKYAHFFKKIRQGLLAKCQFPQEMTDKKGKFTKPIEWDVR